MATWVLKPGDAVLLDVRLVDKFGKSPVKYPRKETMKYEEIPIQVKDGAFPEGISDVRVEETVEYERVIASKAEYKAGDKTRARVRAHIERWCTHTPLSLFCEKSRRKDLDDAIAEARADIAAWNKSANTYQVTCRILLLPMTTDSQEAADAIRETCAKGLVELLEAIDTADPNKIRQAALGLNNLETMIPEEWGNQIVTAKEAARKIASACAAAIKKGNDVEALRASFDTKSIDCARIAFIEKEMDAAEATATVIDTTPTPQVDARPLLVEDEVAAEAAAAVEAPTPDAPRLLDLDEISGDDTVEQAAASNEPTPVTL